MPTHLKKNCLAVRLWEARVRLRHKGGFDMAAQAAMAGSLPRLSLAFTGRLPASQQLGALGLVADFSSPQGAVWAVRIGKNRFGQGSIVIIG